MYAVTYDLADLLISARRESRKAFLWYDKHVSVACAVSALYTRKQPSRNDIKSCISLIKKRVPMRSAYRHGLMLPAAVFLAAQQDATDVLSRAISLLSVFERTFKKDNFLALTALLAAANYEPDMFSDMVARAHDLMAAVKAKNEALIGGNFASACVWAAAEHVDVDSYAARLNSVYRVVGKRFYGSRGVRTLAQVLAMCEGSPVDLCNETIKLYDTLLDDGFPCGTSYELPIIGYLASLSVNKESLKKEIEEVFEYLSEQRGFKSLRFLKKTERLLLACLLVSESHAVRFQLRLDDGQDIITKDGKEDGLRKEVFVEKCLEKSLRDSGMHYSVAYQIAYMTALTVFSETSSISVGL